MRNKKNVPEIRFKGGFTEEWKICELEDICVIKTGYPFNSMDFSNDGDFRVVTNGNIQDNSAIVDNLLGNKVSIYNKQIIEEYGLNIGDVLVTMDGTVGRSAKVADYNMILAQRVGRLIAINNTEFLYQLLNASLFYKEMTAISVGGTIKHISLSDIGSYSTSIPTDVNEQIQIGIFFKNLDDLIVKTEQQINKLKNIKKACLEKMFPRNGSTTPELRFKGFTEEWIIKKFGTCVLIQRGGSPRPIEEFITDDENGINWIKIGDVSTGSRYITSTNEKIKPEGESKSRRVEKGDLILSNSMSFGRPYIMQIDGCIHDGWLLIRNDKGIFDLEYLLQMLSSDYMLTQYKSLASGGVVNNLNSELVQSTTVQIANVNEQIRIGFYFKNLDDLIAKTEQQINKLKNIKKACLDKMFVNTEDKI